MALSPTCLLRFDANDPWDNLAREEIWLDELPAGASALILYVNSACVVFGKHQNPLREIRLAEAAKRGVPLLRRSSGGGTVWHDEGNLNWSFLLPKDGYDRTEVSNAVADCLRPLGFSLEVGEKGDLFHDGKKVSGAAYLFRRDRVLHHGTLLCSARLGDLRGVLGPTGELTEWVGVASRPMPVTNLNIDVGAAAGALAALVPSPPSDGRGDEAFEKRVAARALERKGSGWLWDHTPPFTWQGATPSGPVTVRVADGRVLDAWDDRSQNLGNIVGKRFFSSEFFETIPREAP